MSTPIFFLEKNSIDNRWKVLDNDGFPFADAKTKEDAINGARNLGVTEPIAYGSNLIVSNTDETIYNNPLELAQALAELSGFKIHEIYDDDLALLGYTMELVE